MAYLSLLQAQKSHINTLRMAFAGAVVVGVAGMYLVREGPLDINVHTAPNMEQASVTRVHAGVAPIPRPNVYGFAYYIWQQANRWNRDGGKDYGAQIFVLQDYVTPRCREYLEQDMRAKAGSGELNGRTRSVSELPGSAYTAARVVPEGASAWTVYLDLNIVETMRGQVVKDTNVRYPLRVVRYEVDMQKNPWRMAIDCSNTTLPTRLEIPADATTSVLKLQPLPVSAPVSELPNSLQPPLPSAAVAASAP